MSDARFTADRITGSEFILQRARPTHCVYATTLIRLPGARGSGEKKEDDEGEEVKRQRNASAEERYIEGLDLFR